MDERPALPGPATAIAIVLLVMSGLTLLSSPCGVLAMVFRKQIQPGMPSLLDDPVVLRWTIVSAVLSLLIAAARAVGAGALLARRDWCRPVLNVASVGALGLAIVGVPINVLVVMPRTVALLNRMPHSAKLGPAGSQIAAAGGALGVMGSLAGAAFGIAVAVATLVILTRPDVRVVLRTQKLPDGIPRFPGSPGGE